MWIFNFQNQTVDDQALGGSVSIKWSRGLFPNVTPLDRFNFRDFVLEFAKTID